MTSDKHQYDRLVDNTVKRSGELQKQVIKHVEKYYHREKLHHGVHMIELLSERLALSEHGLHKRWTFPRYKETSKAMGIWF